MIRFIIFGIGGRLGNTMAQCISNDNDCVAVAGVDKFANAAAFSIPVYTQANDIKEDADIVVDFSRPDAVYDILPYAHAHNMGAVLATTGYTDKHMEFINSYADKIAIFQASNMSVGVNLLIDLAKRATAILGEKFEIEIIEKHHNIKVDSPSGTALSIAKAIEKECINPMEFVYGRHSSNERRACNEIGIHAVRGGTIVGEHEVMFIGNDEVITLSHQATSKAVFAEGAIKAGKFICGKSPKIYDMLDLLS